MDTGIPHEELAAFCRRNHIRRLSLFGSWLRGNASPESDMDFLVEFDPGHVPGLIRLTGMEAELSGIIGRKADLRTSQDLSRYFREEVVGTAELLYVEG